MIMLVLLVVVLVVCILVLYQMSRGPIFVPTKQDTLDYIVNLAELDKGPKNVVDLGSGDGRVIIAAAKAGSMAVGYEVNPVLVWWSRHKINNLDLSARATVKFGDFWTADLSQFDVVFLFGINYIMSRLERKLLDQLRPGSIIISNAFEFPHLQKVKSEHGLIVYKV